MVHLSCLYFPDEQEYQRKLSQLTPEKKKLTEKLQNMSLNNLPGEGFTPFNQKVEFT